MKGIVYHAYGSPDVVRCVEIEEPSPAAKEVLIKVRAASVNPLDWRMMKGLPAPFRILFRLQKPTESRPGRPGRDVAGTVEAVGSSVRRFKPGDHVFGSCQGAFAEHACAAEESLVHKPSPLTFEQAAAVPVAALTALQGLRDKGRVRAGQKVLINGAAGGVGTFAVQLAKTFGAEVTGVCSTGNLELVRSLGADRVIDYTREDFMRGGQRYDVLVDCVGNVPLSAGRRALVPHGTCVIVGAPKNPGVVLGRAVLGSLRSPVTGRRFVMFIARLRPADLATVADLMQVGKVTAVIDRRFPLAEAADALRCSAAGHARGKVVIVV